MDMKLSLRPRKVRNSWESLCWSHRRGSSPRSVLRRTVNLPKFARLIIHRFKNDDVSVRFLNDPEAQKGYKETKMLSSCAASDYKALFYVGGHGPGKCTWQLLSWRLVFDLAQDSTSIALGEQFWKDGKPVGAICHGPAALVNMKDPEGKPIVSGRRVTSFSNAEEEQVGATDKIPFLVETKLKEVDSHSFLVTVLVGRKIREKSWGLGSTCVCRWSTLHGGQSGQRRGNWGGTCSSAFWQ